MTKTSNIRVSVARHTKFPNFPDLSRSRTKFLRSIWQRRSSLYPLDAPLTFDSFLLRWSGIYRDHLKTSGMFPNRIKIEPRRPFPTLPKFRQRNLKSDSAPPWCSQNSAFWKNVTSLQLRSRSSRRRLRCYERILDGVSGLLDFNYVTFTGVRYVWLFNEDTSFSCSTFLCSLSAYFLLFISTSLVGICFGCLVWG